MNCSAVVRRLSPFLVVAIAACSSANVVDGTGGSAGGATGGRGSGGTGSGGTTSSGGSTSSGGATATGGVTQSGGSSGTGGVGTGGAGGTGGSLVGTGGTIATGGSPGGTGGAPIGTGGVAGGAGTWRCPSGPFPSANAPVPGGATATRVMGVPPTVGADGAFNNNGNDFTNIEGPVWVGDALYVSELTGANIPPARILKITEGDAVSVAISDSGTNGLAIDPLGNLVGASHGVGGIVRFALPAGTRTTLVSMYNGMRLNSPNDLAVRGDGTIYFTDPSHQNNARPQGATRVYRLLPTGGAPTVITDYANNPNGITLSPDEQTLYVGGGSGVKKYAVSADGSVSMLGAAFGDLSSNTDGMTVDCAGNLFVTVGSSTTVAVFSPGGARIGQLTAPGVDAVTNVAFGGSDHRTLYITGYGGGRRQGLFKVQLTIPGRPY